MKAVCFRRFGGPEVLEIAEYPDPHPPPGQVRIAVRAAGVNSSDWKKRQGLMDQELPQTLGYEAAGVVDEIGAGVTDVAAGDRVFGFCADGAAQAELAVLSDYVPVPAPLDFAAAAALRFSVPPVRTFPLTDVAEAHRAGEGGHARGKLVLVVNGSSA